MKPKFLKLNKNYSLYTEGKKKRRVNILGDLILFIRMFFFNINIKG